MSCVSPNSLFVSRIEFIRAKLSNFSAHVSGASDPTLAVSSSWAPPCDQVRSVGDVWTGYDSFGLSTRLGSTQSARLCPLRLDSIACARL